MTTPRSIVLDDVAPGDLVFLESNGKSLGEMVRRYDGSPFSHVGVAVDRDRMTSCRTSTIDYDPAAADLGGVRDDSISGFRERRPHVGRPVQADVDAAQRRVDAWRESGAQHRSRFSFVKLFMVAAGLNAVRGDLPAEACRAMLGVALRAAREWTVEPAEEDPGFFCSEMVALAFDKGFTVDRFRPPPVDGPVLSGLGGFRDWVELARRLSHELPDGPEARAFLKLLVVVRRHDPSFLAEAVEELRKLLGERMRKAAEAGPGAVEPAAGDGDPLPAPLVTVRMLRDADWVDWRGPVVFPS